ncbi:hypothetical protein ACRAR1_01850 [Streptomyces sanyensis]|uniref:hypothetical protein n=1 Tax=Streptomyces sanyensis TaxID=568869 RepID=UPI003D7806D7
MDQVVSPLGQPPQLVFLDHGTQVTAEATTWVDLKGVLGVGPSVAAGWPAAESGQKG